MIDFVFYVLTALFGLKICVNLVIPYGLAWSAWKGRKQGGISLMPYLEIGLLLLAIIASAFSRGQIAKNVAIWGGLAIVISYVHLLIAGMICGLIVSKMEKRKEKG